MAGPKAAGSEPLNSTAQNYPRFMVPLAKVAPAKTLLNLDLPGGAVLV